MTDTFEKRLNALTSLASGSSLGGGQCGVEKESLRVTPEGYIAPTPHFKALGSALTNKYITTDYSESLLEFVTPPVRSSWEAIQFLCDIHQFVYEAIEDELLWALSMPCMIKSESDIPLANYGNSNVGTMKTVYRRGLGYRYGRRMQAISGIHFNYSLPENFWRIYRDIEKSRDNEADFRSDAYLGLVRNVRRLDWVLLYLFGASPAVCKSFLSGVETNLAEFDHGTLYGPYATSLRMSDIGYQHSNQASLNISANSLGEYIRDLNEAVRTPNPEYQKIGVKVGSQYRQLNVNHLQIENEYYSTIRPKRVARSGERATQALQRGGVEYVELRALDISPYDPVGISQSQIKFLEVFSIYCLLTDSAPIGDIENENNTCNRAMVADRGRQPGLELRRGESLLSLTAWGEEICAGMFSVAEILDQEGGEGYRDAIRIRAEALADADRTPSAMLLSELKKTGQPMFSYAMSISRGHAEYFKDLSADLNMHREMLNKESISSLERQTAIEAEDRLSFEEYLDQYFR
jgi:glutamate--cysteine ligase